MFDVIDGAEKRIKELTKEVAELQERLENKLCEMQSMNALVDKLLHKDRCYFCGRFINGKVRIATITDRNDNGDGVRIINHKLCENCFKHISFHSV